MDWSVMHSAAALAALLAAAVWSDLTSRRIPNVLVASGLALGLLVQAATPAGSGLFGDPAGALGLTPALLGALTGLAVLLPMYLLRALGAGDVKLLAMVGAWLGAQGVLMATLWSLLAGGVLALGAMFASGACRAVLNNLRAIVGAGVARVRGAPPAACAMRVATTGRLPYAVAIGCGSAVEVMRQAAQF